MRLVLERLLEVRPLLCILGWGGRGGVGGAVGVNGRWAGLCGGKRLWGPVPSADWPPSSAGDRRSQSVNQSLSESISQSVAMGGGIPPSTHCPLSCSPPLPSPD